MPPPAADAAGQPLPPLFQAGNSAGKVYSESMEEQRPAGPEPIGTGRSLAYLKNISVDEIKVLRGRRAQALRDGGVSSITDLLFYAPRRYIDRSEKVPLGEVPEGDDVTVVGVVGSVATRRPRRNLVMVEAVVADETGSLKAVWFNQPYRANQLKQGTEIALAGKVERFRGRLQMNSPALDVLGGKWEGLETGRVVPTYRAVGQAGPGYLRRGIWNALRRSRPIPDPVPPHIVRRYGLMERDAALVGIHFPETVKQTFPARRRLAFDEFFRLELALAMTKQRNMAESSGIEHRPHPPLVTRFLEGLPFDLTEAQQRVIDEIQKDMARPRAMQRLLQGEVGSGKTVVAMASALTAVAGGYQAAVMAPTEVLAVQHFQGVRELIALAGMAPSPDEKSLFDQPDEGGFGQRVKIGLLTGEESEANFRPPGGIGREELLEMIKTGEVDVVIGTHALISAGVRFHRLGAAVVDEQHRFGVRQRQRLHEKAGEEDPDLLIMTATPIPRTLAVTLYGDLDISTLDILPPGRSQIKTWAVDLSEAGQRRADEAIRREVAAGRQVFVVCPRVEETDKSEAASAQAEHRRLRKELPELRLGLLHGRMRAAEKDRVMGQFRAGALDALVSTTVIEVGIDVPNASLMVIRDADRFGLSQLHQLRGRVGRGKHPSQCVLMAEPSTEDGAARIQAMVETDDGFALARKDLELRQSGTVFGERQSGVSDLKVANILRDVKVLEAARKEAFALVEGDPRLDAHPELREEVRALLGDDVEWLFAS